MTSRHGWVEHGPPLDWPFISRQWPNPGRCFDRFIMSNLLSCLLDPREAARGVWDSSRFLRTKACRACSAHGVAWDHSRQRLSTNDASRWLIDRGLTSAGRRAMTTTTTPTCRVSTTFLQSWIAETRIFWCTLHPTLEGGSAVCANTQVTEYSSRLCAWGNRNTHATRLCISALPSSPIHPQDSWLSLPVTHIPSQSSDSAPSTHHGRLH